MSTPGAGELSDPVQEFADRIGARGLLRVSPSVASATCPVCGRLMLHLRLEGAACRARCANCGATYESDGAGAGGEDLPAKSMRESALSQRAARAPTGRAGAAPGAEEPASLVWECLGKVRAVPVRWLWPGRVPFGKLSVLDGNPGVGKSTIALGIAAALTTGHPLPGSERGPDIADVIFVSAEDGAADTLRPRFEAAGGDPARLHVLAAESPWPCLPDFIGPLRAKIDSVRAGLLVLDPLMSFFSARISAHVDQEVRQALAPLAAVAEATGCAVLALRHLNKFSGGGPAIYRGLGSIGIAGQARSVLLAANDPNNPGRRLLTTVKSNLGQAVRGVEYAIGAGENGAAMVLWGREVATTADEIVAPARGPGAVDEAAEWLREYLQDGERPSAEMVEAGAGAGHSTRAIERARRRLRIVSRRVDGVWLVSLPEGELGPADQVDDPANTANTADPYMHGGLGGLDSASASDAAESAKDATLGTLGPGDASSSADSANTYVVVGLGSLGGTQATAEEPRPPRTGTRLSDESAATGGSAGLDAEGELPLVGEL